jgi:ribosome-associated protein
VRKLRDVMADRARAEADDRDLGSRSDARTVRLTEADALLDIAGGLAALSPKQLELLELSDELMRAILEARAIDSPAAKSRQLKIVRRVLKNADWEGVQTRLDAIRSPSRFNPAPVSLATPRKRKLADLATQLLEGGDAALDAWCAEHPGADRTRLRQLLRNARAQTGEAQVAPLRKLTLALAELEPNAT